MEKMKILFGFDSPEIEEAVKSLLRARGVEAEIVVKFSKSQVKDYLERNTGCNTAVLKEIADKHNAYTAEELAQLTDLRDINVIVVLSARHKSTEYVHTLYSAGITNAVFQEGRKGGATPKELVELILQRRPRKLAREIYGINSQKLSAVPLDIETCKDFYKEMKEGEGTLLENYLTVCSKMSPRQIADFTKRLPENERAELMQFEEFHTVMRLLKKFGYDLKYKKPKKAVIGLAKAVSIEMKNEFIHIDLSQNAADKPLERQNSSVEKRERTAVDAAEAVKEQKEEKVLSQKQEKADFKVLPEEKAAEEKTLGIPLAALFSGDTKQETAEKSETKHFNLSQLFGTGTTAAGREEEPREEMPADAMDPHKEENQEENSPRPAPQNLESGEMEDAGKRTNNPPKDKDRAEERETDQEETPPAPSQEQTVQTSGNAAYETVEEENYDDLELDYGGGQNVSKWVVFSLVFLAAAVSLAIGFRSLSSIVLF